MDMEDLPFRKKRVITVITGKTLAAIQIKLTRKRQNSQ